MDVIAFENQIVKNENVKGKPFYGNRIIIRVGLKMIDLSDKKRTTLKGKITPLVIQKTLEEAKYLIEKPCTIKKMADIFKVDSHTISYHLNSILPRINKELYEDAKIILEANNSVDRELIIDVCTYLEKNNATTRATGKAFGINHCTVLDYVSRLALIDRDLYNKIMEQFDYRRRDNISSEKKQEINQRVLKIYNHMLLYETSYTETAEQLGIERHTVIDDIKVKLPRLDPLKYVRLKPIIQQNRHRKGKSKYEEMKLQVIQEADFFIEHRGTIEESARNQGLDPKKLRKDLTEKLLIIDEVRYNRVQDILAENLKLKMAKLTIKNKLWLAKRLPQK